MGAPTKTTNYDLWKPFLGQGQTSIPPSEWASLLDFNWDTIDAVMKANESAAAAALAAASSKAEVDNTSIPENVGSAGAAGGSGDAAARDHVHKGLYSIKRSGSSELFGAVTLAAGANVSMVQAGNTITIASTGGGGGVRTFDAVVDANGLGDYLSLGDAVGDGKLSIYIKNSGVPATPVTETADITLLENTFIFGEGEDALINLDIYRITTANNCVIQNVKIQTSYNGVGVRIGGNDNKFYGVRFESTHSGGGPAGASYLLGDGNSARTGIVIQGCDFVSTLDNANVLFVHVDNTSSSVVMENCKYSSAHNTVGYVYTINIDCKCSLNGIDVLAGKQSVSIDTLGLLAGKVRILNCDLSVGELLISDTNTIGVVVSAIKCGNLKMYSASSVITGCVCSNLYLYGIQNLYSNCFIATAIYVESGADNNAIANSQFEGIVDSGAVGLKMTNCYKAGTGLFSIWTTSSLWIIQGCYMNSSVTINGDRINFIGNTITGTLTVGANADDTNVCNNSVGDIAGGGAGTITITAGADRTVVIGNRTDAAIVDGGAGTVPTGATVSITDVNVVY